MIHFPLPLIGFCAYSGTGKTTLLRQLIPLLKDRNLRTGVVKHAHHRFDIDHPGKDSYELRQAGANQIAVASKNRTAWIEEHDDDRKEPVLNDALSVMDTSKLDLVLVEGFKTEAFPKIELHRPSRGKPLMCSHDQNIIALATDEYVPAAAAIHQLNLNDVNAIADFIISYISKSSNESPIHAA